MNIPHFNPHDMADDMLRQVATGRETVLQDILATARQNLSTTTKQHLLAVAPRGYGKSFLARLVALNLQDLQQQGLAIAVALLPEEQPNITAPHLLLDEICRVFEGKPADSVIPTWFDEDDDALAWDASISKLDAALDARFGQGQGMLVAIVENFGELLNTIFRYEEAQSRLRKLLSSHPRLMWLVTSATAAPDKSYEARLFQAFRQLDVEPWTEQQCIDYFNRQLQSLGQDKLTAQGEARARTLALFIGGTPRLAALLAEILANKDAGKAATVLDTLVDRLTPYYKHRIESLAFRPRKLLDALLRLGEPCSQSELAQRVGAGQASIAQPFQELQRERLVIGQRATGGRETLYRVADRVLAHYYRKRFLLHGQALSPLEAIAEFLEAFFTLEEKRSEAERMRQQGRTADAEVLERLVTNEMRSGGSWRSRVFATAYRLRVYAEIIAPAALQRFGLVLELYATYRFIEALREFQRLEQEPIPDNEWLIGLLLVGSIRVQLFNERQQGFAQFNEAVKLAEQNGSADWQFIAYNLLEMCLWEIDQSNAIAINKKAAAIHNQLGDGFLQLEASYTAGVIKTIENSHTEALMELKQAAKKARLLNNAFIECRTLRCAAWNLGKLGKHEEAITAAHAATALAKAIGDDREQANSNRDLAFGLGEFGHHEEAIIAARIAIALAEAIENDRVRAESNRHLAFSLRQLEKYEESLEASETALSLAKQIKSEFEQAWALREVFFSAYPLQRYNRSLEAYLELLTVNGQAVLSEKHPEVQYWLDYAAYAAFSIQAWPKLQETIISHAQQFSDFPIETSRSISRYLVETANTSLADAFAATATFIDILSTVFDGTDERVNSDLQTEFAKLFTGVIINLAQDLNDARLLRDIARRIAERIPKNTEIFQQLLEGAARYVESNGDPKALERLDPDIATAILRTRAKSVVDIGA